MFLENYVVFVLKNNYNNVVFVTIFQQGKSDSIELKTGQVRVVNETTKNQSPFTVGAKDIRGAIMNINGKSSFSLIPGHSHGDFMLLEINRPTPSRFFMKCSVVYTFV